MVKTLFSVFFLFFITVAQTSGQCGNLYIGGVFDGSLTGGTPKGIQICASGDIADLSIYAIGVANNGGGSDGPEYDLPALPISSGECFWIANEGSNAGAFQTFFGFAPCYLDAIANINGDDPIELFCSGILEDEFGDVALDGSGECWEYLDGWGVNALGAPNFGNFDCNDWSFSGTNTNDGETSNALAAVPYPSPEQVCPAILPVSLVSFTAILQNNVVEVSWSTVSEINNDYFEVLRSSNGVDYKAIGTVNGNGTSLRRNDYKFIDIDPSIGTSYYRLNQVDLDGRNEYFHILRVENKINKIKVYPTTCINTLNIEIDNSEAQLAIVSITGETYRKVSLKSNFNSVDVTDLPSGIYYVRIESGTDFFIERIVKN